MTMFDRGPAFVRGRILFWTLERGSVEPRAGCAVVDVDGETSPHTVLRLKMESGAFTIGTGSFTVRDETFRYDDVSRIELVVNRHGGRRKWPWSRPEPVISGIEIIPHQGPTISVLDFAWPSLAPLAYKVVGNLVGVANRRG